MNKINGKNLAKRMMIALVLGLACGIGCIMIRESLFSSGQQEVWASAENLLFADITKEGNENAIGIFYLLGQLFVNSLQLIIVPMVFTSITLAMCHISDTKKLGRISYKTLGYFLLTSVTALILAGIVGFGVYYAGWFEVNIDSTLAAAEGTTGSNPLLVILQAVPNNIMSAFSNNGGVLAIVFLAGCVGLSINALQGKAETLKKLLHDINDVVVEF